MTETVSFTDLTRDALRNVSRTRSLFWLVLPVGILISSASFTLSKSELLLSRLETEKFLVFMSSQTGFDFLLLISIVLALTLVQVPIRGITLILLQSSHQREASPDQASLQKKDYWHAIRTALTFEIGYWLTLTTIGLLIVAPCVIAWRINPSVFPNISQIGFLLFIGTSLYLYFIKELSLFYGLVGKTHFRSSIDLGFRIFRRHSFLTLLYFTYVSILSFLATTIIAILSHTLLITTGAIQSTILDYAFSAPFFGIYFLFDQALRLVYFRKIASTPKSKVPKIAAAKSAEPATGMNNI